MGSSTSYTISNVTANTIVYARFTKKYYTITYVRGDYIIFVSPDSERIAHGANASGSTMTVSLSTAKFFYGIDGWYSGSIRVATTTKYAPTKVTADATYTAKGTKSIRSYTLTVTSGPGGTVSGSGTYDYGTKVTIKATAHSGFHFVKWDDDNINAIRDVIVTDDTIYTAIFEQDSTPLPQLNLDKTSLTFEATGGTQTVKVTSNVNWTVS